MLLFDNVLDTLLAGTLKSSFFTHLAEFFVCFSIIKIMIEIFFGKMNRYDEKIWCKFMGYLAKIIFTDVIRSHSV